MLRPSLALSIALAALCCAPAVSFSFSVVNACAPRELSSGYAPRRHSGVAAAKRAARKARNQRRSK